MRSKCFLQPETSVAERPQEESAAALRDPERQRLLVEWNRTATEYPRNSSVAEIFESETHAHPADEALRCDAAVFCYAELNARANQLARHLIGAGIGPGLSVGLFLERSADLIVAMLAVLKAGAAYAPLGLRSPPQRLASMLQDLRVPLVLTRQRFRDLLDTAAARAGDHAAPRLVCLDTDWPLIARESIRNPGIRVHSLDAAYISFTSGSTGRPKGVCVPHRGIVRLVRNNPYASFANEVILQLAPTSFDASLFEIWGSLLNGLPLVLAPPHLLALSEIAELIRAKGITTAWFTTGLFNQLVEEVPETFGSLKQVLTGGEAASPFHIKKALAFIGRGRIINGYGPTENTTFSTTYTVPEHFDGTRSVPIGRPIANTTCYILDHELQPVPIGQPGELFVGGDGLALGYLNRPERTAQRFIPNPFQPGSRLYRTGDKVRYLEDGNIEFIGRMDMQVKIRGFRVEPGEIEAKLLEHPGVRQCAVVARPDHTGLKQLVAYVVTEQNRNASSAEPAGCGTQPWPEFLRRKLPDFMVPSFFIQLKRLPLTPNGKVDYRALPAPNPGGARRQCAEGLRSDTLELELQDLWSGVLGVRSIGPTDNFFVLGGHSLLAMRLAAEIEKRLGKSLSVTAILENPTIKELAETLRGNEKDGSAIVKIQPNGNRPPLLLVHGAGGGMFWGYSNLARHLGESQPLLGFKSQGLDGLPEPDSIQALATGYIRELRKFQPEGPYYLGGYCFGGLVAYEMARQLEESGQKTALLALVNTYPPNSSYSQFSWAPASLTKFVANVLRKAAYGLPATPEKWRSFLRWWGRRLSRRVVGTVDLPGQPSPEQWTDVSEYSRQQQQLWQIHVRAWSSYHPQPYGGRLTLFRSTVHQLRCSFDEAYGWRELARGGVDVYRVPSGHDTIMQEPQVKILARAFREVFDRELR